jgi:proline iminopeptidase
MEWAYQSASVDLPINFAANNALVADMRSWPDDYLARLAASLECPATFIHGEGDPRPASAVRALAEDHAFELIPGAGHSPWREQPELVRSLLRRTVSGEEGA